MPKPWWRSKTILAGIGLTLQGLYSLSVVVAPYFGWHVPAIPQELHAVLTAILGPVVIHGRATAEVPIQ